MIQTPEFFNEIGGFYVCKVNEPLGRCSRLLMMSQADLTFASDTGLDFSRVERSYNYVV